MIEFAGVQGIEIRDAVNAENDGFAIDDELPVSVLKRRLDDPGIAFCPVVAALGHQPHAIVLPDYHHPVAVILHLVNPSLARWYFCAFDRQRKAERLAGKYLKH
jgi:hypothetical protein